MVNYKVEGTGFDYKSKSVVPKSFITDEPQKVAHKCAIDKVINLDTGEVIFDRSDGLNWGSFFREKNISQKSVSYK